MTTALSPVLTRAALAARIDHTLLRPEATAAEILAVAVTANTHAVAAACVNPNRVALLADALVGPLACAVVGFPSGAHHPDVVATEAARAVADGAAEIDMVIDLGAVFDGNLKLVRAGIEAVRGAIPGAVLKVICESALLTDEQLVAVCEASIDAGADFVKTSTGMSPAGGATVRAVKLMAATVHPHGLRVKASGGIRTLADARAMLAAGADRLGCSATAAILATLDA